MSDTNLAYRRLYNKAFSLHTCVLTMKRCAQLHLASVLSRRGSTTRSASPRPPRSGLGNIYVRGAARDLRRTPIGQRLSQVQVSSLVETAVITSNRRRCAGRARHCKRNSLLLAARGRTEGDLHIIILRKALSPLSSHI